MALKYNVFRKFYEQPIPIGGSVADGAISTVKLANGAVTAAKFAVVLPLIAFAGSDESTSLTVANNVIKLPAPIAMTITKIKAYVSTAPTGSNITLDVKINGVVTSTITITATNKIGNDTSFVDATLAEDDELSLDITAIGSTIAGAGLKIFILGNPL